MQAPRATSGSRLPRAGPAAPGRRRRGLRDGRRFRKSVEGEVRRNGRRAFPAHPQGEQEQSQSGAGQSRRRHPDGSGPAHPPAGHGPGAGDQEHGEEVRAGLKWREAPDLLQEEREKKVGRCAGRRRQQDGQEGQVAPRRCEKRPGQEWVRRARFDTDEGDQRQHARARLPGGPRYMPKYWAQTRRASAASRA